MAENSAAGTEVGAVIPAATDANADTLTYSMGGADAASFAFDISTRQITTVATDFNHEATKNSYTVTVTASDGTDSGTITVTIDVTDVAEKPAKPDPPTVTPQAGVAGSLVVSWVEPGLNGGPDITRYDMEAREGIGGTWVDGGIALGTTTSIVQGLDPDTGYQFRVKARNGETDSDWSEPSDLVKTNAAPTVTDVSVTSTPVLETDTYGAGESIEVSVTFSEAVNATSATDFVLSVSGGGTRASLVRGSGTATLVFGYTVAPGDEDDDGIWIGDENRTLVGDRNGEPQSGTITSVATSTPADLDHVGPGTQSDHKVDGLRSIVSVAVSSTPALETDTYGAGETIRFTVTFNVAVDAAGTPSFEFALDGASRVAPYETGSGTTKLVFGYTVVSADDDDNGIFLWDEQDLDNPDGPVRLDSGDTIRFAGTTTDAPLYWEGRGTRGGHKVDGSRAGVNRAPVFDPATATRQLLENSPADTSVGAVIPEATDADNDTLTYDMAGADAALFAFDTSTRQITTVATDFDYEATKNTYTVMVTASDATDSGTITVTINVVNVNEKPDKPDPPTLAAVAGSSTSLTATWTAPGANGGAAIHDYDLDYREGTTGSWEDFEHTGAGVMAMITGLTASTDYQVRVRANGDIYSDWSDASDAVSTNADTPGAPAITGVAVTSTPATSGTYGWGETIEISVTFTEAVDATSATDFELNVGGSGNDRSARRLRGSGSETLVFGYTVVSGDEDDDGIWIGDQDRTLVGDRRIGPQTGTITSTATSTEADLTHAALGTQSGHKVDGSLNEPSAPTITEVAVTSTPRLTSSGGSEPDTYGAGERIDVTVTFSEAVTATSDTDFVLNVSDDKRAPWVAQGLGTPTLVFGYTVVSSDEDDDGIWIGDQDRTLVGDRRGNPQNGEITSEATDAAADLTHDALGTLFGHKVDGSRTTHNNPPFFNEGDSATRAVASGSGVGTEVGGPVLATDLDQDELTYSLEENELGLFGITRTGAQIVVGPNLVYGSNSREVVTVNADDGRGGSDTIAVTINFKGSGDDPPENRPPTVSVTPTVAVVSPGGEVMLTAVANDPDGDPLEYEWTVSPANAGMFDATDGRTATWTAASDSQGSLVLITVTVVDPDGATEAAKAEVEVTDELTVRVTAVPDPPEVEPGGQVMLTAVVLDPDNPDGSGLTYMWDSEGGRGNSSARRIRRRRRGRRRRSRGVVSGFG